MLDNKQHNVNADDDNDLYNEEFDQGKVSFCFTNLIHLFQPFF